MDRPGRAVVLWLLVAALAGGCPEEAEDPLPPLELDPTVALRDNPDNPFSVFVELTVDEDVQVQVEHGLDGAFDRATPLVAATAGDPLTVLVLGLAADRTHELRLHARDGERHWRGAPFQVETAPLPGGFPTCKAEFFVDESEFDAEEVICTNAYLDEDMLQPIYLCVDRWGTPVWWLRHPADEGLFAARPMTDGRWASVGAYDSHFTVFDHAGGLVVDYQHYWFEGKTRFPHHWIDVHETLEITEGPWAGAVAFLTVAAEVAADPEEDWLFAGGIIVFDPRSEEVLWDWTAHGDLGDGVPISPLLDYERQGYVYEPPDWLHANALVHGVDDDGQGYFWISLLAQDWIIKVDVQTDEVLWRFGREGDFTLVDDLDAADPQPLDEGRYMYSQHAPEWISRDGDRTRFLVFDNGTVRPDQDGEPTSEHQHSRVVEFELDEATMRATVHFDHGDPDPQSPDHFWSPAAGDADLLPGGDAVQYVVGAAMPPEVVEVGYPDGELRWKVSCGGTVPVYRVNYFPTLYDTTWWYDVER